MLEKPTFLQGVYQFKGAGLHKATALEPPIVYNVPFDKRSQLVYFRAGNPTGELIYVLFRRDSKPMRYFPIGARAGTHVELAVVEDLEPETTLEVLLAAPEGLSGPIVLDIGLVEI